MCLAIPGRIVNITDDAPLTRSGRVSFGGIVRNVNLSAAPEATIGDYVLIHAGFAIGAIDPDEAARTLEYLGQLELPRTGREDRR